jgi:hypothetical protein
MKFKKLLDKLNENILKDVNEKWVEYDFNFGENKKEGIDILKQIRKQNKMPKTLPGEKDLTSKRKKV